MLCVAGCSSPTRATPLGPTFDATLAPDAATDHLPDARPSFDAIVDAAAVDAPRTMDAHASLDGARDAHASLDGARDAGDGSEPSARDASDASDASTSVCPSGTGTLALLGGNTTSAVAAVSTNGSPFKVSPLAGASMLAAPAMLAFGGGFLGVFPRTGSDALDWTSYGASSGWSAPAPIVAAPARDAMAAVAATTTATVSLAVLGPSASFASLVYYGSTSTFLRDLYSAGGWGPGTDAVDGTASQDFGPSPATSAAVGSTLYVAYDGANNGLYVDSVTSGGSWTGASGITGAGVGEVPPSLVALTSSASGADVLLVYEQQTTNFLYSVAHTAAGWSMPLQVSTTALATTQVALAPLAGGGVVMVYEGTNGLPYSAVYSATASPAWTAPVEVIPGSSPVGSPPSVAAGTCGFDAVAALVQPAGVAVVTLSGGTWSSPTMLPALGELTYATIATIQ